MDRHCGLVLLLLAGLLALPACFGTRQGVEQAQMVGTDMRRSERLRQYSSPEEAQTAMGRAPDIIQQEGDYEVHYYSIRGAAEGESVRLVYKNGKLVDRGLVKMRAKP